jgi:predicted transcriptional regulator
MKRTTIVADEEVMLEIQSIAQRENRSTSNVIREALATYVHRYHSRTTKPENPLLAIAALGQNRTGETDVSERVEEILADEIDPKFGWSLENGSDS